MNRISPIFQSNSHLDVYNEITRLDTLYRKQFKRALPENLLHFASWGGSRKGETSHYGISLMWETHENACAQWVKKNVLPSEIAQPIASSV